MLDRKINWWQIKWVISPRC